MKKSAYSIILLFGVCLLSFTVYGNNINELSILTEVADSLHNCGRTDSAAVVGQRVITMAEKSGNPLLMLSAYSSQGVYLRSMGKVYEALESYEKALKIATSETVRKHQDQEAIEEIASLYINLAVLNLDMQQKDDAIRNAVRSADWISKSRNPELKSMIFGAAGSVLTGCGDLPNAMKYQGLAYSNALESGNDEAAFRAAAYTMLIADRTGDKSGANEWRIKCRDLMPKIQSSMALLVYYQAECSICLKNNNFRGSIVWFDRIMKLDGIDNLPFVKLDCYGNMHEAYAKLGDYRNAYDVLLKAYNLRNDIWEEEKSQSLQELTVKYDAKEKELALAQSEVRRAGTLMWLVASLGLLLIVAVVFIIYVYRQKRRRMQQYIQGLENERRRMSTELHDGVCNDLLAIEMKMAQGELADNTAGMIQTCREAVRRISHELMPPEFSYADINEVISYYLVKQRASFVGDIEFEYTSEAVKSSWRDVPEATALDVYRIVQEAVGNAVKHSGANRISVFLSLKSRELSVIIADNGTYKFTGKKGLGVDSMCRRAESIGGSVETITDETGGTEVKLSVKI